MRLHYFDGNLVPNKHACPILVVEDALVHRWLVAQSLQEGRLPGFRCSGRVDAQTSGHTLSQSLRSRDKYQVVAVSMLRWS